MPVNCTICNKEFINELALFGHSKTHGLNLKPVEKPIVKLTPLQQQIRTLQEARERRHLKQLEDNEILMLELENKRLREELHGNPTGIAKTNVNQPDNFEQLFNQLAKLDNWKKAIKDEILLDLENTPEETASTEDTFLKIIVDGLMTGKIPLSKNAGYPPAVSSGVPSTKEVINVQLDLKEIVKQVPEELRIKVKQGAYSKEQVIAYATQSGLPLEKAEELYELLRGD